MNGLTKLKKTLAPFGVPVGDFQRHCAKCGKPFQYDLEKRRPINGLAMTEDGDYIHERCPE